MKKIINNINYVIEAYIYFLTITKTKKRNRVLHSIRLILMYCISGVRPREYAKYELYDTTIWSSRLYITKRKNMKLNRKYNDDKEKLYLDDKSLFLDKYKNKITRSFYIPKDGTLEEFNDLNNILSNEFFIKDNLGLMGIGVKKYFKKELSFESFKKAKGVVYEDAIIQNKQMKSLNHTSVNTLRIYTVKDKTNRIHIISCVLRMGRINSHVDNAASGGLFANVNLDYGIVDSIAMDKLDNKYLYHPDSNTRIIGFEIPYFNEAIKMVKSFAKDFENVSFIGWDVGITESGPEVIEGNTKSDTYLMQQLDKIGKYKLIKSKLKQKQ